MRYLKCTTACLTKRNRNQRKQQHLAARAGDEATLDRAWQYPRRRLASAWTTPAASTTATACTAAAASTLAWGRSLSGFVLGGVLYEQGIEIQCVWKEEIPAEFHFGGQGLDYYFFA